MLLPSLPINFLTDQAAQVLSAATSRASSAAKSFESDLDSGNIAGAQSFLSTLQQKLSETGANSAVSSGIAQIGNDLKSGNLAAARLDFADLKQSIASAKQTPNPTATGDAAGASLAALNLLQQSAYSAAIGLSMPAGSSSLSVNF